MNQEDIIKLAREANIKQAIETPHLLMVHELARFAALVAEHEREQCALIAAHILKMPQNDVSAAIRARGSP